MAKESMKAREVKRAKLVARYAELLKAFGLPFKNAKND
ncbi:30S ribosomal protein S14 [Prevotella sp. CAG:1124]|nr:30S ribosomal protein S14 [Prevotella sp. CAG:1124]